MEVSTLTGLYLKEKVLEEEFPGIGFRDSASGREAYLIGHRVAIWEVIHIQKETRNVAKTAEHFRWPAAVVRCALAYAKAQSKEVSEEREAELGA